MTLIPTLLVLISCTGKESDETGGETGDDAYVIPVCDPISGGICTWAGTGEAGFNGDGFDIRASMMYFPMGVTLSDLGPTVVADWNNHKIRMVEADGTFTTIMGTNFVGDGPSDLSDLTAPGADGTTVNLNHPTDQVYRSDGILVSASWHTHKIRTWDPATGLVLVFAGSGSGFAGDNGEALSTAKFNQPKDVIFDAAGNLYVVDMRNEMVRKISTDSTITTIVGNATKGFCGDDGPGRDACLAFPLNANPEPGGSIALSSDGAWLYIADTENHRIRVYDMVNDVITTLAGNGTAGFADGAAATAQFNFPREIDLLDDSTLLVADSDNHRVRRVDLATGTVSTFAGTGEAAFTGDGGPASEASFNRPFHVTHDQDGNVYVSDTFNHRVRVIYP